ncbi:unnamed protein product [Colias eurytheme]|nr:unnamed protein product [Colias eurytheme]
MDIQPYNWLKEAHIYNKNNSRIDIEWLTENADAIVLLFTSYGVDKDGILQKFYTIYENVKFINMPIEVIYVPMDEREEDMMSCYERQANWFTLKIYDPLIQVLKHMYGITCTPYIVVIRPDGLTVSTTGIRDLEEYGKNALITWLSNPSRKTKDRKLSKESIIYGKDWKYVGADEKHKKQEYHRRFSVVEESSS